VPIGFGGSGKPELDLRRTVAGTRVPWQYNNMVTKLPQVGWIVMRLDDSRPSTSLIDWRTIDGERILTVATVNLYFCLYVPSLGAEARANRALRLRLEQRRSSLRHFVFSQSGSVDLLAKDGSLLARLERSTVEVTPTRGLDIRDIEARAGRIRFRVSTNFPDAGLIAWFVDNPNDNSGVIPVGEVRFGRNGVSRPITVSVRHFPSLTDADTLYIEAMSLYDARHLWAFAKAPLQTR
jgi:hypothetical protein